VQMSPRLFTVGYEGRSIDELVDALPGAGVERLVDVRELPLSRRRGFSKTALGDALRRAGISTFTSKRSEIRSRTASAIGQARLPTSSDRRTPDRPSRPHSFGA
jgi:Protein of unknown function, DUF488